MLISFLSFYIDSDELSLNYFIKTSVQSFYYYTCVFESAGKVAMNEFAYSLLILSDISVIIASKLVSCAVYVVRLATLLLFGIVYFLWSKSNSSDVIMLNADISYRWQPE